MSEKKKPNGVQLLIRAVVRDPEGKVLSDTGRKPAKSFVIQFLEFINPLFQTSNNAHVNVATTSGGDGAIYMDEDASSFLLILLAGINVDDYGIVVGTGDTAVDNEDYALDVQLTEGTGAGNITHGAQIVETTALVNANVDLETKRPFTNNTGSSITVKEAGIYVKCSHYIYYICIVRDVLETPIEVPDKCSLTVYYTLRTTV